MNTGADIFKIYSSSLCLMHGNIVDAFLSEETYSRFTTDVV
jgi:hypothetical protein